MFGNGLGEKEVGREGIDGGSVVCVYVSIDALLCGCLAATWCLIYCKNGN